jgi:uncharacterized membrane protein
VDIAKGCVFTESDRTVALPVATQALLFLLPAFAWGVWLTYLCAAIILAIGLVTLRDSIARGRGVEKIVALSPVLIAIPIAVFGMDHFTAPKTVAAMVPAWLPGHLFWALFVGACLIASALSIAAGKYAWLASALLGVMICLFVLLIHIPNIIAVPHSRILWVVALRDSAFAGGAFALSAAQKGAWSPLTRNRLITVARIALAAALLVCGIEQFLYPALLSGVPLAESIPVWMPARLLWSYVTGVVFVGSGAAMLIDRKVRLAATAAGIMTLLLVIVVYVPLVMSKLSDIGNGLNYLVDTMLLCGSLLALAGAAQSSKSKPSPVQTEVVAS